MTRTTVQSSQSTTSRKREPAQRVDPSLVDAPEDAAVAAGLRYTTDQSPGIQRRRAGRHFRYIDVKGNAVRDERALSRIKALAIPPAWIEVWICPFANGHLQATGRDARGRKQYRYHPKWREARDETKYGRMLEFGRALPAIRAHVNRDLGRHGLPREKVIAAVVWLLERTLIRVGNEEYARSNDSYGLTTLRDEHVDVNGGSARFLFRGKGGKEHQVDLRDRRLARIVERCRDLPGQVLFQYVDDNGQPHSIGSSDVNDYLRKITGEAFTAKDFRTWFGTVFAAQELLESEPAETERERKQLVNRAIDSVAERLGNTPAICRRCYVHPIVLEAYDDGRLFSLANDVSGHDERGNAELSREEVLALKLIDDAASAG